MESAQQHQQVNPHDCDLNELSRRFNELANDYQQFRHSVVQIDTGKEKRVLLRPETPSLFYGQANENIDSWLYELELYFEAMRLPIAQQQQRILFTKAQLRGAVTVQFTSSRKHIQEAHPGSSSLILFFFSINVFQSVFFVSCVQSADFHQLSFSVSIVSRFKWFRVQVYGLTFHQCFFSLTI